MQCTTEENIMYHKAQYTHNAIYHRAQYNVSQRAMQCTLNHNVIYSNAQCNVPQSIMQCATTYNAYTTTQNAMYHKAQCNAPKSTMQYATRQCITKHDAIHHRDTWLLTLVGFHILWNISFDMYILFLRKKEMWTRSLLGFTNRLKSKVCSDTWSSLQPISELKTDLTEPWLSQLMMMGPSLCGIQVHQIHWPNVALMLAHRLRRWANIDATLS